MTILSELTKPALKKQMRKLERAIKIKFHVFLFNEVNDNHCEILDKWLVDEYQEIEATYNEVMRRYKKPIEVTIMSKVKTDNEASRQYREHISQWDLEEI